MKTRSRIFLGGAAPLAICIALGSPAQAQTADTAGDEVEAIVVTGSRIARPDLESASPIAVVSQQDIRLQAASANIENVLNDLPQVTGSTSGTDNNPGGGIATVNLRNLGTQRTLVLVNGRRYVSFDTSQVVDLNTIPSALVDRVEVLTGGRSAVYGSDAIAGVVNFVLKNDFEGVELNSQYGLTDRGDSQYWDVNGTIGANFADNRGNVTTHVGYTKRRGTFAQSRKFARNALQEDGEGGVFFGGSGSVPQGRVFLNGANYNFGSDGSISPYGPTDAYNYAPVNYLQVPQERFLISTRAQYEISSAFKPYLEGQFINNRVTGVLAATPIGNSTPFGTGANQRALGAFNLHVYSPFFNADTQSFLAGLDADGDGYVPVSSYGFRTVGVGPRRQQDERNAFRLLGGMSGDIGSGWNYDGYYMYARTKNTQRQTGNVNLTNFLNGVSTGFRDPVTGDISGLPNGGDLVCASGAAGCVPTNLFGIGNLTSDQANFLALGATNIEEYTTQVASFAITNSELFDLGAGGVGVSLGVEWRKESGRTDPDQNLSSGNVAGFNPGAPTGGSYDVLEFFGEVNVPLLRDQPFAHLLELNGAARYSNYSNAVGNVFTWAAGGQWEPVQGIGFRGQYQRAIRGPSVNELFLGQTVSFDGASDPCGTAAATAAGTLRDQCLANGVPLAQLGNELLNNPDLVNPPTTIRGNQNLREEKSKTWTVGAVLSPSFIPRFSATVDYYNIKIDGYISRLGQANLFAACFDAGLQEYCGGIGRTPDGLVDSILDTSLNSGGLKTNGIDVGVSYNVPLNFGLFGAEESKVFFSFNGSRLLKYDFTPIVGIPIVNECAGRFGNNCGQPTPKWKHVGKIGFTMDAITLQGTWRYIGKVRDDDDSIDYWSEKRKAKNYFDLAASFEANDNFTLSGGMNNVFDKKPPLMASAQNGGNGEQSNTYPNVYDVLGRSFFVNATLRF
ncbi:TonB-dependent receptor domain-containing protein [Sphingomonas sp. ID0503]|uniref:TonB-dependent receptor domain-containing protein n=1 Tax=Sphingomonas sp. ID0503 TaxID=3399691 RepID=UPI003AFA2C7B